MSTQHLPIWYLGQINPDICDKAISEFELIPAQDAKMGVEGEFTEHSKRKTTLRFAESGHWFGNLMFKHGLEANVVCGWDYAITGHENVQYGSYGPDGHYDWHTDTFPLAGLPTERKVSVVCLMSDPSEYEGGELQIKLYQEYTTNLKKGDMIAFPSMLEHRVVPVISGTRNSAVVWLNGPRFK